MRWKTWLLNQNALLVAAALLMAGCAFLLAHRYLQGQEAATRRQLAGQYATRDVLVAAHALPAATLLEPQMLARRAVPERFLASDALNTDAAASAIGRRLLRALDGGETITASALASSGALELSALVEPGLRALTIPVDESNAAAGLIAPGDYVDLLLVARPDAPGSQASVRPLLQAVRVVATGQQLQRPSGTASGEADSPAAGMGYATVSLRLPPEDAERVLLAQRMGDLAVLLRPAGDAQAAPLRAVDEDTLFGNRARRHATPAATRVQFIIGGRGEPARTRSAIRAAATAVQP
ncbi:MAG TPA: Flp pilus assembly protein CpaB [Steroidobacteraceae bacterium]|nr:Flp pilus assembly protein CpaB [Steroidobacteraceae bacterium]